MNKLLFFIFVFFSILVQADDLVVITSSISCVEKDQRGLYKYEVGIVVQNMGKSDITLITKSNRVNLIQDETPELILSHGEMRANGVLIIPPREELGLVTLRPSDGAQIHNTYLSRNELTNKVIVGYEGVPLHDGRYGNWEGLIKAEPKDVYGSAKCKP